MDALLSQVMGMEHAGAPDLRVSAAVIVRLADEAAGLAGARHAGGRVVTAGIDRVSFRDAVQVGDQLTAVARVNAVWRTSAEVGVRVTAQRSPDVAARHVMSAYFTMVAIDGDGRPMPLPPLDLGDDEARGRHAEARQRRAAREQPPP